MTERLTFVTGNLKKLEEVAAILGEVSGIEIVSQDIDLPELQGEPDTICIEKCRLATQQVRFFFLKGWIFMSAFYSDTRTCDC